MQILEKLFNQITEAERVELVAKLVFELGVNKSTVYRWAKGTTKPTNKMMQARAKDTIEDFALEIIMRRHNGAAGARRKLNQ